MENKFFKCWVCGQIHLLNTVCPHALNEIKTAPRKIFNDREERLIDESIE